MRGKAMDAWDIALLVVAGYVAVIGVGPVDGSARDRLVERFRRRP